MRIRWPSNHLPQSPAGFARVQFSLRSLFVTSVGRIYRRIPVLFRTRPLLLLLLRRVPPAPTTLLTNRALRFLLHLLHQPPIRLRLPRLLQWATGSSRLCRGSSPISAPYLLLHQRIRARTRQCAHFHVVPNQWIPRLAPNMVGPAAIARSPARKQTTGTDWWQRTTATPTVQRQLLSMARAPLRVVPQMSLK